MFFTFIAEQINVITSYLDGENVNGGLRSLHQQKVDVYKKNLKLPRCMCEDSVTFPTFQEPEESYVHFSEVENRNTNRR